ncbi:hypothetical protein [Alcaligenes nematophilus]|uniref:hypothetical protein n=1 Tax=Alcaligenes nematophilus TaxID=2994643 RepID=UPI00384EB04D
MDRLCCWINRTIAGYWAEVIWLGAGVLIGGAIASYWVTGLVFGATWWDALAAIGTVGAVFVAVSLAFWSRAVNSLEAYNRGVLAAAVIEPRLASFKLELERFNKQLNGQWAAVYEEELFEFKHLIIGLDAGYDLRDLEPLGALQGDASLASLRALRGLENLKLRAKQWKDFCKDYKQDQDRRQLYKSWSDQVLDIIDSLEAAQKACMRVLPFQLTLRVMY